MLIIYNMSQIHDIDRNQIKKT